MLKKKIQKASEEEKDKILLELLPNLYYDQFQDILDLNIEVFNKRNIYKNLLKAYNSDWYKIIQVIEGLKLKKLYLTFLKIENDDKTDFLQEAFDGNYDNFEEIQDYSQIKSLFPK